MSTCFLNCAWNEPPSRRNRRPERCEAFDQRRRRTRGSLRYHRPPTFDAPPALTGPYLRQAQPLRHQILHAFGNDQRLWNAPQRRERESLSTPRNHARSKVDINLIAGNDRLLLRRNFLRELLPQAPHQFRYLHAQESVVIRVAQIGLREAG